MASSIYEVGSLVNVTKRTWSGINKEGGVGRIISINDVEKTVDVKYILTGTEKNIDLGYVQFHKFLQDDDDNKKDDSAGRGNRRTSRRAKIAIDNSPVKVENTSATKEVHPITPATSGKKSKKKKSPKSAENDLDLMIQAIKISTTPPVVTPGMKEKKRFSDPKPNDSPVVVAASSNGAALKKSKKIQKKKLRVKMEELSKVINAEMVDTTLGFGCNIPERITKKQKTIKPKNPNTQNKVGNEKEPLKQKNKVMPHQLKYDTDAKATCSDIKTKTNYLQESVDNKSSPEINHKTVITHQSNDVKLSKIEKGYNVTKIKNGLEVIYRDNSKKAASFVNDVVGAPPTSLVEGETSSPKADEMKKENLVRKVTKIEHPTVVDDNESENVVEDDEEELLRISAEEERSRLFDSLLSDVMTKRMLDEMSMSEMLKTINDLIVAPIKEFSDLEFRSQLTRLEEQNRIMVTWEDGIVYQI